MIKPANYTIVDLGDQCVRGRMVATSGADRASGRSTMRLSVVVTVGDRSADLERTLCALRTIMDRLTGVEPELVVAADGRASDPLELSARFGARVVRVPGYCPPTTMREIAGKAVSGRRVLFVEAGTRLDPATFLRACAEARESPGRPLTPAPPGPFERFRRAYASGIKFLLASSH